MVLWFVEAGVRAKLLFLWIWDNIGLGRLGSLYAWKDIMCLYYPQVSQSGRTHAA